MRYREGDPLIDLPPTSLHDETFIGTALYCLALGIGGIIAGWYGKKLWVTFWSGTLVVASMTYLGYLAIGR
jgi:hypothetical protein